MANTDTVWQRASTIAELETLTGLTLAEQAEVARLAFEKRDEAHLAEDERKGGAE